MKSLRVGISQIPNTTDIRSNLATILQCIRLHASNGTDIVVFPECSLTGFSAEVRSLDFTKVDEAIQSIHLTIEQLKITVVVPSVLKRGANQCR
jgi:predicted amidohydrolase